MARPKASAEKIVQHLFFNQPAGQALAWVQGADCTLPGKLKEQLAEMLAGDAAVPVSGSARGQLRDDKFVAEEVAVSRYPTQPEFPAEADEE